ncbi:sulfotransferase family protein [Nocardioides mangrovicus]|nr:sulfotransferase [Nocardioides mangrovicus]
MRPSFLVIGGQRCGTTTIFKVLSQHPQLARPPVEKGTDYFTLHYSRGMSWYRSQFSLAATARARAYGHGDAVAFEACTYYLFHPLAIPRLANDLPDVKLVAMLRDPVERAYSAYKHEFARGFDVADTFDEALELEDSRLEGEVERILADPDYESIPHRHHAYRRRGQYAEQLRRVLDHFPREQLHVMDSELFFADPQRELADLLGFLGLEAWSPGSIEQHNARPGTSMSPQARARLTEHYASHDAELAQLLGRQPGWRS